VSISLKQNLFFYFLKNDKLQRVLFQICAHIADCMNNTYYGLVKYIIWIPPLVDKYIVHTAIRTSFQTMVVSVLIHNRYVNLKLYLRY
jgi:hypothetical protein